MRIEYARYRTLDRAREALDDMYAAAEVSDGDRPRIEARRDHKGRTVAYIVTLAG